MWPVHKVFYFFFFLKHLLNYKSQPSFGSRGVKRLARKAEVWPTRPITPGSLGGGSGLANPGQAYSARAAQVPPPRAGLTSRQRIRRPRGRSQRPRPGLARGGPSWLPSPAPPWLPKAAPNSSPRRTCSSRISVATSQPSPPHSSSGTPSSCPPSPSVSAGSGRAGEAAVRAGRGRGRGRGRARRTARERWPLSARSSLLAVSSGNPAAPVGIGVPGRMVAGRLPGKLLGALCRKCAGPGPRRGAGIPQCGAGTPESVLKTVAPHLRPDADLPAFSSPPPLPLRDLARTP